MYTYIEKKNILLNFYRNLNFKGFKTITEERKEELDKIVLRWFPKFQEYNLTGLDLISFVARRLVFSAEFYGLLSGDEKAYFFINMVDPNLIALECYESSSTKKEIEYYSLLNLKFYSKALIVIEKYYNEKFKIFDKGELWALERIKKDN